MTNILTQLRKSDDVHYEIQFDKSGNTLYIDKDGKVIPSTDTGRRPPEAVDKYRVQKNAFDKEGIKIFDIGKEKIKTSQANITSFTKALNKSLNDFQIDTCLRKIHFLAQSYHESQRFRKTYEESPNSNVKGGEHFRGRGLIQLTHDYNYSKLYEHKNKKKPSADELFKFATNVAMDINLACEASGYYWNNIGAKTGNISQYADKDDILTVSREVNGYVDKPYGLDSRKMYALLLKKILDYEKCTNKK
ncbi:hypothetical protein D3C85_1171510 [compost metagenome]